MTLWRGPDRRDGVARARPPVSESSDPTRWGGAGSASSARIPPIRRDGVARPTVGKGSGPLDPTRRCSTPLLRATHAGARPPESRGQSVYAGIRTYAPLSGQADAGARSPRMESSNYIFGPIQQPPPASQDKPTLWRGPPDKGASFRSRRKLSESVFPARRAYRRGVGN